jgi:hypothetical protein
MGDVDSNTLAEATHLYTSLRRRYWRFYIGGVAVFAALATLLFASGPHLAPLVDLLAFPLIVAFLSCCMVCLSTWSSLIRFHCPRCDERFILSWSSSWPRAACKHCGLTLRNN